MHLQLCNSILLSSFSIYMSNVMICQQNVAVCWPWSTPTMCHPGRVDRYELIGSPYSALRPINASEMMNTSLDAGRQSCSHHSSWLHMNLSNTTLIFISMWLAYKQHMQMDRQFQLSPMTFISCTMLSFIIRLYMCARFMQRCTDTHVCMQCVSLYLSISFDFNMHSAGGQRSLLYIRSASFKRHQSHPTLYNNEIRRQWKTITSCFNLLNENRLSPRKLGKGLH